MKVLSPGWAALPGPQGKELLLSKQAITQPQETDVCGSSLTPHSLSAVVQSTAQPTSLAPAQVRRAESLQ